jgi:tetratricopeptide (TPR) repeat protein
MATAIPQGLQDWFRLAPPARPLTGGDQWNVFLSYRSIDRPWVLNLYDVLTQHGFKVFIDQCTLVAGDELITRLQDALRSSQAGVLIWSSSTADSTWVSNEYQSLQSKAMKKPDFRFVPIRLDNSELPDFAENRIFLDFSTYPDGPNGGELLRLLYGLVGQPLTREAADFALQLDETAKQTADEINAAIFNKDPDLLIELFKNGGLAWQTSSSLVTKAAEGLIKLKRNDDAIAMLEQAEKQFPHAIRPQQLHALALARRGTDDDLRKAQRTLGALYQRGERDPETLGIYARTWMDRYKKSKDVSDLQQSRDLYAEAFERAQDDYYTGINAASKSALLGTPEDIDRAEKLAERVQKIVGTEPVPKDYWKTATVGEVFLLMKNYAEAARLYKAAVAMARAEVGSHESTWTQACLLMQKLNPSSEERALIRAAFSHLPDCDQMIKA